LPIPLLGQELLEPPREAVKLFGGQLGDGGLKFFASMLRTGRLPWRDRRWQERVWL
jgi:hypothetical protein